MLHCKNSVLQVWQVLSCGQLELKNINTISSFRVSNCSSLSFPVPTARHQIMGSHGRYATATRLPVSNRLQGLLLCTANRVIVGPRAFQCFSPITGPLAAFPSKPGRKRSCLVENDPTFPATARVPFVESSFSFRICSTDDTRPTDGLFTLPRTAACSSTGFSISPIVSIFPLPIPLPIPLSIVSRCKPAICCSNRGPSPLF